MSIQVNEEQIARQIAEMMRADYKIDEDNLEFTRDSPEGDIKFTVPRSYINQMVSNLSVKKEVVETVIYDDKTYEALVSEEARFRPSMLFRGANSVISKEDKDNGVTYRLGIASDEYFLFFLTKLNEAGATSTFQGVFYSGRLQRIKELSDSNGDMLSFVKLLIPRLLTVKVVSERNRTPQDMNRLLNAFLFQLTYNLDVPLVEVRYLDEYIGSGRLTRTRRLRVPDIEAPKRLYIQDLTYHYQMGVSTDSPALKFLSFYHVAEHFFDQVYNEDLIEGIKNKLTLPDFSYRRKKDIQDLVKYINNRMKVRGESMTFSEQEALRLTITKYVDLSDVLVNIQTYDESLIAYYRANQVKFSDGDAVDLESRDTNQIADKLAKRIYKTRNSVVHSKEGEKTRYVPFEHDGALIKEVPLLRFIAESIIIKTSSILN